MTIDSPTPDTVRRRAGGSSRPQPATGQKPTTRPTPRGTPLGVPFLRVPSFRVPSLRVSALRVSDRHRWPRWLRIGGPGGIGAPGTAVLGLALFSFAVSLILQLVLYPQGSGDADEAAYVLQARMMLDGHLTLDAHAVEPYFRPWLTGVHDGHVFTKYLPGWPALLAASQAVFGTMTVAPAAVAALWVIGAYLLARELFDDAWTALAASVLLALSPLFLLHTALPLAYGCCAAVLTLASALLLRGARTGSRRCLAGGGALAGFALLIRPFDAVLVLAPLMVFVAVRQRRTPRTIVTRSAWAALGAAPLVAILLAYCWHVTGSPLRLPLSASDPLDTFGFGARRILPGEKTFLFTRRAAADALWDTLGAAPSWFFGGLGLIALAVVGLLAPRRRAERLLLGATTAAVLVGYVFWWGSAFAVPGLRNGLGPHYHVAGFTPVVILAAAGARWLWLLLPTRPRGSRSAHAARPVRRVRLGRHARLVRPVALALAAAGLLALTLPTIQPRLDVQRNVNAGNTFLDSLVPDDLPGPALVVVTPGTPSRYTQVPYHTLRNSPELDGPVIYAADIGPAIAALPDRVPGRTLYRLRPDELVDAGVPGSYRGSFVPLTRITGTRIEIRVTVKPPAAGAGGRMYVRLGGQLLSEDLSALPVDDRAGTVTHTFVLTAAAGGGPGEISTAGQSLPAELVVGLVTGDGPAASGWEERTPLVRRAAGDLALLTPGLGWRNLPGSARPGEQEWLAARVQPTLDVTLTSAQG